MLLFFTGIDIPEKQKEHTKEYVIQLVKGEIDNLDENVDISSNLVVEKEWLKKLLDMFSTEKVLEGSFNEAYHYFQEKFREKESIGEHSIANLALLDANSNRSYKNAFFPIKRQFILSNDQTGKFIPLCTKNVFSKAYSKKLGEVMFWNKSDSNDYFEAIQKTLEIYS